MSEYVLKTRVDKPILESLNQFVSEEPAPAPIDYKEISFINAIGCRNRFINQEKYTLNDFSDWIAALKSGKKIVNLLSPREELNKLYALKNNDKEACSGDSLSSYYAKGFVFGMLGTVQIIAKEHPDVADWLKGAEKK